MNNIDWSNATREPSGYPDSLGDVETLKFGRVASIQLPHATDTYKWVKVYSPIGPRLLKRDKVRVGRAVLELSGRSDLNDKWTDDEVAKAVDGRVYPEDHLTLHRYPNPAESHKVLLNDVSYSTGSSSGSRRADEILVVPN